MEIKVVWVNNNYQINNEEQDKAEVVIFIR